MMANNEKTKKPAAGFDKHPENINRNGRPPKGYSITEAFKSMLAADPEVKKDLVEKIKLKALQGDVTAMKLIWNYMDGMPLQATDITSNGEQIQGIVYLPQKKPEGA